jgi:hypothetical protein
LLFSHQSKLRVLEPVVLDGMAALEMGLN